MDHSQILRNALRAWVLLIASLAAGASVRAAPPRPTEVLLLDSYNSRMGWTRDIIRAVEDELALSDATPEGTGPRPVVLHVEFMDSKVFYGESWLDRFRAALAEKYHDHGLSLVLCAHNNALEFLRRHRDALFPGVPIVFGGINAYRPELIAGMADITGVAEAYSIRETVDAMLALHPDTHTLYVVNDHLTTGRAQERDIARQLKGLGGRLEIVYAPLGTLAEHRARLQALSPGTLVLLGTFFADTADAHSSYENMSRRLTEGCPVPVYCLLRDNVGAGCVGGRVASAYDHGRAMARLGRRVLAGEAPADLPVQSLDINPWLFDAPALARWGIDEDSLPAGSTLVNVPFSLWRAYRWPIVVVLVVVALMMTTIALLFAANRARRRVERRLRESEERLAAILNSIGDAVLATDARGVLVSLNPTAERLTGLDAQALCGATLAEALPIEAVDADADAAWGDPVAEAVASGAVVVSPRGRLRRAEGEARLVDTTSAPIRGAGGAVSGVVLVLRDVTVRAEMEARLLESQKMEAVGQLAGGIAHDFNNVLTGISGFAELIATGLADPGEYRGFAEQILTAAGRARALVRQLLDFSRKGPVDAKPTDVHALAEETMALLERSVSKRITAELRLEADDAVVIADATQLQQALLNLGVNARDAMPDGGRLVLATRNVTQGGEGPPGDGDRFLEVSVSDTGPGVPPELAERIFEPFFTTKPRGEGTGLGLAAVHGIVRSHGGILRLDSPAGEGATFRILLPIATARPALSPPPALAEAPATVGTVLVIDDDDVVRGMVGAMLASAGYAVLSARDGAEGLRIFDAHRDAVSAVLLDMIMPGMPGEDCLAALRERAPRLHVVLATGYSQSDTLGELLRDPRTALLQKPFVRADLLAALTGPEP